ncbi:M48 family metallopeptidase [Pelomonas sp. KK5]|uniref:M48 family metallopeptidase n=1 Tax=Pelomonas sp. KK5 TaxID=1855730 RepID=UPI00097BE7EC|nr:SprT family zinc-dependent metalloprotease [Pelomonas sp. KK5]
MPNRLANLLQDKQLALFDAEPAVAPPPDTLNRPGTLRETRLGEHRVQYELKRARRRSIGFIVGADGLRVSAPRWLPQAAIDSALVHKSDWILRKLVEQRERAQRLQASRIEWRDGATMPYLGEPLRLVLRPEQSGVTLDEEGGALLVGGLPQAAAEEQIRDTVQAWLQRRAKAFFEPRCQHYAAELGVTMKQLRLSSAQTRWGSASADGSIRLHWRLIHYAPSIIDYVVAHELAHLREMNHSPRFWDLVRSVMPDFEEARGRLKDESIGTG